MNREEREEREEAGATEGDGNWNEGRPKAGVRKSVMLAANAWLSLFPAFPSFPV